MFTKRLKDPRYYQIVFLSSFLLLGMLLSFIDVDFRVVSTFILSALCVQGFIDRAQQRAWNWKSALITSLSLCLLLRVPSLWVAMCASGVAITSKVIFKVKGNHIFNPANIGIVCCVLFFDAWISPGQWGHHAWMILVFIGLGFVVSFKAARSDVAIVFLGSFIGLLFLRGLYLGDPLEITLHQLNNGALLLFAFFMITDPRTSPKHKTGRICYAVGLAAISFIFQYYLFIPQGMLFALALICFCVPILNVLFVGRSYRWAV